MTSPKKLLLCNSNFIIGVVMWPKFRSSSISMREVNITKILKELNQKKPFFEGCSWFKFNNLGLVLGMTKCGKRGKTKRQKMLGANFYVCRNFRGKTGRWSLPSLASFRILFWVNTLIIKCINKSWRDVYIYRLTRDYKRH